MKPILIGLVQAPNEAKTTIWRLKKGVRTYQAVYKMTVPRNARRSYAVFAWRTGRPKEPPLTINSFVNHKLTGQLKNAVLRMVVSQVRRRERVHEKMTRSLDLEDTIAENLQRMGQLPQTRSKVAGTGASPKQPKGSRTPGKSLSEVCDAVAAEMQETAQSVVNIANTIASESEALAELLHKHGTAIEARIEQFMSMSDRVKAKMREAHDDMLGTGTGPSLAPREHHED